MKSNSSTTAAFTLLELLVVIAIIGLLSSVVFASVSDMRAKARDTRRISDLNQIRQALEFFYDDNGHYPPSACGWDCNGYFRSYNSTWDSLAQHLEPYLSPLPEDPINSSCPPWTDVCFSYTYGNVWRYVHDDQYDLTTRLETDNHPQRCAVKGWRYFFDHRNWCGPYSDQIYEASPL